MLLAVALAISAVNWVPMRWMSHDPASLKVLDKSPVNCLLLEQKDWADPFLVAARERRIAVLGVVHAEPDPAANGRIAVEKKLAGIVLEGEFEPGTVARVRDTLTGSGLLVIELPPRRRLRLEADAPVIGTYQGVWPGVQVQEGGEAKSAPSGTPWIDTNTGFLRFLRASTKGAIWMANRPPEHEVVTTERYLQAIGDAEMVRAHWVLSLDADLQSRLLRGEAKAVESWRRISDELRYYANQKEWRDLQPYGQLAIVQDVDSGALLSGGILDMIAVKHTPVRPVANRNLTPESLHGAQMTVDVDPTTLSAQQKDILKSFSRGGGTVLNGPPGWRFPAPTDKDITLGKDDTAKLDEIWKEVNNMTGRRNMGVRLFNVSSMLSSLMTVPDGKQLVLFLVNYSDFPVESVTVHLQGSHHKIKLYRPEGEPVNLSGYEVEEGTGVDIDKVGTVATLLVED